MAQPTLTGESNEAGLAVFGTAIYEPDPNKIGTFRVKRDELGQIMYTPESVAKYQRVLADRQTNIGAAGSAVTGDPVALYYAKEREYQDHPERVRPAVGPHSKAITIPPQYLAPIVGTTIPNMGTIDQDAPIVLAPTKRPVGRPRKLHPVPDPEMSDL